MSSSLTPEQVAKIALKEKADLEARVKYLQTQLGQLLEEKRRSLRNSRSPTEQGPRIDPEEEGSHPHESSSEEDEGGRPFRPSGGGNLDFKVDIPEYEGHLDPDVFLDWLRTVERVFDHKDIPDEKKAKLVALKLRKYASIWWANLLAKRARKGKQKIRTCAQMRDKLKAKFLPAHYLHDNYLKQGTKSVEEYTREFEQLLLKCDLREDESQTLVRYLSGLDDQIAHVIELHPYSSLAELSSLAYKVEQHRTAKGKGIVFKDPQTQLLDHKLHHLRNQTPQMLKTHLKETILNRKIEGGVFDVKDKGTLLSSAQTRELLLWLNFKLSLRGLMARMKKGKNKT